MTRCSVCSSPDVQAIDSLLAAGRSGRSIALEFSLGPDSMKRHAKHATTPKPVVQPESGDDPLSELVASLRLRALAGSDPASREYRLGLASLAARGAERPEYDPVADARWVRLRTILLDAFADDPAARLKLADAIRRGEAA